MDGVGVEMDHVVLRRAAEHLLHQHEVQRQRLRMAMVEPQRALPYREQLRGGGGIAAREQRHPMPGAHELFGQVGHDALGTAVQPRWNTFIQGRHLCDAQLTAGGRGCHM